jgi:hypothetical protein
MSNARAGWCACVFSAYTSEMICESYGVDFRSL